MIARVLCAAAFFVVLCENTAIAATEIVKDGQRSSCPKAARVKTAIVKSSVVNGQQMGFNPENCSSNYPNGFIQFSHLGNFGTELRGFYDSGSYSYFPKPKDDEKSYFGLGVSVLALLLAAGNIAYTWKKDQRARKLSIEDDFWLRKVLSPLALEPLIEQITEITSNLPSSSHLGPDVDLYRQFTVENQPKLQKLQSSMQVLTILNGPLCKSVIECIQNIEDEVLDYCAACQKAQGQQQSLVSKSETQAAITNELLRALRHIKDYQAAGV